MTNYFIKCHGWISALNVIYNNYYIIKSLRHCVCTLFVVYSLNVQTKCLCIVFPVARCIDLHIFTNEWWRPTFNTFVCKDSLWFYDSLSKKNMQWPKVSLRFSFHLIILCSHVFRYIRKYAKIIVCFQPNSAFVNTYKLLLCNVKYYAKSYFVYCNSRRRARKIKRPV